MSDYPIDLSDPPEFENAPEWWSSITETVIQILNDNGIDAHDGDGVAIIVNLISHYAERVPNYAERMKSLHYNRSHALENFAELLRGKAGEIFASGRDDQLADKYRLIAQMAENYAENEKETGRAIGEDKSKCQISI